jgi:hypothetical protein
VFSDSRDKLLPLLDEAAETPKSNWIPARNADGSLIVNGYEIPVGRVVGKAGETKVFILFHQTEANVIQAAYPIL